MDLLRKQRLKIADNSVSEDKSDRAKTPVKTENDVTSSPPTKDNDIDKRNLESWKTRNDQMGEKRNFGRWKNRRWHMLNFQDADDTSFLGQHSLSKRFSDTDFGSNGVMFPTGWFEHARTARFDPSYYTNDVDYGYENDDDADGPAGNDVDKRHSSRWRLINQKLASLNNNKRDIEMLPDDMDKRMSGRWRIIQNKLNQLNGKSEKRNAGRWRNYNWLLRQYNMQNTDTMTGKRNLGRWRNRNWVLQQFGDN